MQVRTVRTLLLEAPLSPGLPSHVAAASGLARAGEWLHVVPDDSLALVSFELEGERPGKAYPLFPDSALPVDEKERKRLKPDLESLAVVPLRQGQGLLAVGSGSTSHRCRGVLQPLSQSGEVEGPPQVFALTPLYQSLPFRELNVEGLAVVGGRLFLGQRGNSAEGVNALIELDLDQALDMIQQGRPWGPELVLDERRMNLGEIQGVRLTLTDLAGWGERYLLFSAAAEDTANPYDDGKVIGSILGRYSLVDHQIHLVSFNGAWKVEGVEPLRDGRILMVTDGDDPESPALLLEVSSGIFD